MTMALGLVTAGCSSLGTRFHEVSPGIFEGYKPTSDADFAELKAQGIRTILCLETVPWNTIPENRRARRFGILFRPVPILASPLPPREKRIKQALLTLHDPTLRPIFVHCYLGSDRSSLVIGLYRIYYQDWPPQAAWEEMCRNNGFHKALRLYGFTSYFWNHTRKPAWVNRPAPAPWPQFEH